jgi:hypothetical protein
MKTLIIPFCCNTLVKHTYSIRPKIFVAFASRETTLTKYILKLLIFMIHNWYHWKDF